MLEKIGDTAIEVCLITWKVVIDLDGSWYVSSKLKSPLKKDVHQSRPYYSTRVRIKREKPMFDGKNYAELDAISS